MAEVSIRPSDAAERRLQKRTITILRVGLLEQGDKPFFCLLKNVSATGMQAKVYTSAARLGPVVIRVADEVPIPGKIIWVSNGKVGIGFDEPVDLMILLRLQQKLSPIRRRSMPRVTASSDVALGIEGRIYQGVLKDISCTGARVITPSLLEIEALVFLRLPDLPEVRSYVRWTDSSECGLTFETPIPMQVIARWIDGRRRLGGVTIRSARQGSAPGEGVFG